MRLLPDTAVFLWYISADPQLPKDTHCAPADSAWAKAYITLTDL
jgi:hypothetical protein